MQIRYVEWAEIDELALTPSSLYSFDCHPNIQSIFDQLVHSYIAGEEQVLVLFKSLHSQIGQLLADVKVNFTDDAIMNDLLVEVEWIIEEPLKDSEAYIQAQLMTYAHLISSRVAYNVLHKSIKCKWLDARDVVVTSDEWLTAQLKIETCRTRAGQLPETMPIISSHGIGCTPDNENTLTTDKKYWEKIFK